MVASFGIAVTFFLLTLQPALAQSISARQDSDMPLGELIPVACVNTTDCQALQLVANQCPADQYATGIGSCVCTSAAADALTSCLNCVLSMGALTQDEATADVTSFISNCSAAGLPITSDSTSPAPSGSSGSATDTGASSATATGTGTSSATGTGASGATSTGAVAAGSSTNSGSASAASSTNGTSAALKANAGTFGIMVTAALSVIALL